MKQITENNAAFPDVSVYERTDAFPGVPNAIEQPVKELAGRTEYLKKKVDDILAGGTGGGTSLPAGQEGNALFYRSGSWGPGTLGSGNLSIVGLNEDGNLIPVEIVHYGGIFHHDMDTGAIAGCPASDRWRRIGYFSVTAPSPGSLNLLDYTPFSEAEHRLIQPGQPVKVLDAQDILHTNNGGLTYSLVGCYGLVQTLDKRHRLYPVVVSEGGSNYRIEFYRDLAHTSMAGKTGTITGVGTCTLLSGYLLTGTFVISGTLAANSTAVLDLAKYLLIDSISGQTLTLSGPALSTAVGAIKAVWIGDPELVVSVDVSIKGRYSISTSQALCDRQYDVPIWPFAPARLVQLKACHTVVDTTVQPKISMVVNGNLSVSDASALALSGTAKTYTKTANELLRANATIELGQPYELKVQSLGTGDALNLNGFASFVLE